MGLGSLEAVSLKEARETTENWRAVVRQGKDPIREPVRLKREAAKSDYSLAAVAVEAFEARKADLKGDGKAGRWFSPLELHMRPKIGKIPVTEIDQQHIKNTLALSWHTKADTARKAINRLAIVMRHAAAMGLDVNMQVTDKAKALLGKSRHTVSHISSLVWQEVPAFYDSLSDGTITHLALRLLILLGLHSKPIRFFSLDQIEGDVCTVPADNINAPELLMPSR